MKKIKCALAISLLSLNTLAFADTRNEISPYVNHSLVALRMADSNPSSMVARQTFLDQLESLVKEFHTISNDTLSESEQKTIDELATNFIALLNQQNKLGTDYNNNLGKNIFIDINDPKLANARVIYVLENRGRANLTVYINDIRQIPLSDYKLLFNTSTHYTVTRSSDNTVVAAGDFTKFPIEITADGFTVKIKNGRVLSNDQFIISPLNNAAKNIQLSISEPSLLALAWPVIAQPTYKTLDGTINVTDIIDTSNGTFSIEKKLNPSLIVQFITPTQYVLKDADTLITIEGPFAYDPNTSNSIFPTPNSYDPGYRVTITGLAQAGSEYTINYNLNSSSDNRNGLVMEQLSIFQ